MSEYGQIPSPAYVMEVEKLRRNLRLIADVRDRAGVEIILALKAFALWHYFPLIGEYLNGATASSLNEARLIGEHMGVKAHTYSPAYTDEEFAEISSLSSHITFNSLSQFDAFRSRLHPEVSHGLRIHPEIRLTETEMYDPGANGSRLGVIAADLPNELPAEIRGFHVHVLCENGAEELEKLLDAVESKFSRWFPQLEWLNLGGGHLMTRKGYDTDKTVGLLTDFRRKHGLKIIMEPGSAIAWQTGFLRAKVLDVVAKHGIRTAVLDVSFTAHMPDCLEMPYKPAVRGEVPADRTEFMYRFGGNSCLAGDYIEGFGFERELQIGDDIIFEDMMHYTTVKTTMFNGVQHPSIGELDENGSFRLLREFSFDDYRSRMG